MTKQSGWVDFVPPAPAPELIGTERWPDRVERSSTDPRGAELTKRLIEDRIGATVCEINRFLPPDMKVLHVSILTGTPKPDEDDDRGIDIMDEAQLEESLGPILIDDSEPPWGQK